MDDVLESHRAATLQRCRDETGVPAVRDAMMPDCSPLQDATGGPARPGGGGAGGCGIPAHVTPAMSASGRRLGLLDVNADVRDGATGETDPPAGTDGQGGTDPARTESRRRVESLEMVRRCCRHSPGTRIISVCDREGDPRALFRARAGAPEAAGVPVRCNAGRPRTVIVDGRTRDPGEHLAAPPAIGSRTVGVRARGGVTAARGRKAVPARPARTATVGIRCARVALRAPGGGSGTLGLTAVLATGTGRPPTRKRAIDRLPLTSEGATTGAGD